MKEVIITTRKDKIKIPPLPHEIKFGEINPFVWHKKTKKKKQ